MGNENTYTKEQADKDIQEAYTLYQKSVKVVDDKEKADMSNNKVSSSRMSEYPHVRYDAYQEDRIRLHKEFRDKVESINRKLNEYVPTSDINKFDWEYACNLIEHFYTNLTIEVYDKLKTASENKDIQGIMNILEYEYDDSYDDVAGTGRAYKELVKVCTVVGVAPLRNYTSTQNVSKSDTTFSSVFAGALAAMSGDA